MANVPPGMAHDRTVHRRDLDDDDDDDEEDPVDKMIKKTGCLEKHWDVQVIVLFERKLLLYHDF